MSQLPNVSTAVTAAATLFTIGAYLNAKLGIGYDLRYLRDQRQAISRVLESHKRLGPNASLYRYLELADLDADAIWFEGKTISYRELKEQVDVLAQYLSQYDIKAGQVVGILATNSPEMAVLIFAISKLGAIPGMLNTALKSETLAHCIKVAKTNIVIATPDLVANLPSSITSEPLRIFSFTLNHVTPFTISRPPNLPYTIIDPIPLASLPKTTTLKPLPNPTPYCILLFTSGTTGSPKAVQIPIAYIYALSTRSPHDTYPHRTYSCLPLFHATAFLGFVSSMGTTSCFIISRRFSASRFSQELYESKATRMLYVGEICRYLLAAAPSEYDRLHECKMAIGNGLQKDVWLKFQERFGIETVREFYRSSEGLYRFDNVYGGAAAAGMVGFKGVIGRWVEDDTFLLKVDGERQDELYRDPKTGFCVEAKVGEPGEAVARIRTLEGYPAYFGDKKATEKKFARDVFREGDLFQRSGDLLVRQKDGWIRFYERVGETFRWKGENVSVGEVKGFMLEVEGVVDVVVYGTRLEGYDGQVGTASIVLLDQSPAAEATYLQKLYPHLRSRGLPEYAAPRLVRFTKALDTSATFKHTKEVLKTRSWNPYQAGSDHLYYLSGSMYNPLDRAAFLQIQGARAKL